MKKLHCGYLLFTFSFSVAKLKKKPADECHSVKTMTLVAKRDVLGLKHALLTSSGTGLHHRSRIMRCLQKWCMALSAPFTSMKVDTTRFRKVRRLPLWTKQKIWDPKGQPGWNSTRKVKTRLCTGFKSLKDASYFGALNAHEPHSRYHWQPVVNARYNGTHLVLSYPIRLCPQKYAQEGQIVT